MGIRDNLNALEDTRAQAQDVFTATREHPSVMSLTNLGTFFGELGYAFRLIGREKEILFFAVLQWGVIALAYVLWTQMLDWIPDSMWQEIERQIENDEESSAGMIDLILLGWSFAVVALASFPLSILNAAIVAVHFLHSTNQDSTVPKALGIATRNMTRLWVYTTIDAWITVNAILDRLPKKRGRRTATEELLYYAWKIGTFGVLPALVAGKGFKESALASVQMLKNKPGRVIGVRMGYSLISWIVGIAAYLGALYWLVFMDPNLGSTSTQANEVFDFYMLMAFPIIASVGILNVVFRPFFMIMLSRLYTEEFPYVEPVKSRTQEEGANPVVLFFGVFLITFLVITMFSEQLGIQNWIEEITAQDLATMETRPYGSDEPFVPVNPAPAP